MGSADWLQAARTRRSAALRYHLARTLYTSRWWCLVVLNNSRDREQRTARSYLVAVVAAVVVTVARQHARYALPVVAPKLDDVTTF